MLNINIRINLIRINLTDQLDPYDLRITLLHTQHKCEESIGTVLAFSKNAGCTYQPFWIGGFRNNGTLTKTRNLSGDSNGHSLLQSLRLDSIA
ncbi:hypothetical protein glysoja_041144 [Glycine soja]|uniref:Uncharacterized protein n=1 Tax=Glycine soja TaxID=3848 RepID=A0A0B2SQ10_GLYSO|nr:hypothetical protein glysoja_041144 [Glycine soja]